MISAQFMPNVTKAQKLLLDAPVVLLGDEARVKAQFGMFGGSANLEAR
jgi:hypothetical protein